MFVEEASLVLKQLMGHWMHDVCGNDHRATERGHFAQVMVSATKRKTKGWSCVASFANMQAYHTGF